MKTPAFETLLLDIDTRGVARLTRLIGLQPAFPYLTEGTRLNPEEALKAGLIHELADTAEELLAKAHAWVLANPKAQQPWDQAGYRMPGGWCEFLCLKTPFPPMRYRHRHHRKNLVHFLASRFRRLVAATSYS